MAAFWLGSKLEEAIEIDNPHRLTLRNVITVVRALPGCLRGCPGPFLAVAYAAACKMSRQPSAQSSTATNGLCPASTPPTPGGPSDPAAGRPVSGHHGPLLPGWLAVGGWC